MHSLKLYRPLSGLILPGTEFHSVAPCTEIVRSPLCCSIHVAGVTFEVCGRTNFGVKIFHMKNGTEKMLHSV